MAKQKGAGGPSSDFLTAIGKLEPVDPVCPTEFLGNQA